jgi:hypothetical protein
MKEPQESSEVEEKEAPKVETVDYSKLETVDLSKPQYPFELAQYVGGSSATHKIYECECGSHCFSPAWDDKMASWVGCQTSPLRKHIEEKGMMPERPPMSQHVIILDHEDAHLLKKRRWRALPTPKGHRAKIYLQQGRRARPLQRMIFANAEVIEFRNGCGTDLRRINLRCTTLRTLLRERNARRGWKDNSPGAARVKAWKERSARREGRTRERTRLWRRSRREKKARGAKAASGRSHIRSAPTACS